MGLIAAGLGAIGGVLADQWKEFFYCEAMDKNVLVTKGVKRTGNRSSNTKGSDNIISNGSGIVVADGQCMIIVEQGKIVEVCAEPGEFTYDTSTEPSIFAGNLGEAIKETFKAIGRRFAYGGDTGKDQRVYYFNTKELIDNKFGTANPVPFRVVDKNIGLDLDVAVRCAGVYSYRIADPLLFYTNVSGNVSADYRREELDTQLKSEFISALQPAFAKLSALGLRPNEIIAHNTDMEDAMNEALSKKWGELRGLKVVSVAFSTVTLPEEDQERIKKAQMAGMYRDPAMAGASVINASNEAMIAAANNANGAAMGFMGMGMAMNASGGAANAATGFYNMAQQQQAAQPQAAAPNPNAWVCPKCGATNTGKFCAQCGEKKPEAEGWTCPKCGRVNTGKFCPECGEKKPEAVEIACPKCGWKPEDGKAPKFCPNCGNPF